MANDPFPLVTKPRSPVLSRAHPQARGLIGAWLMAGGITGAGKDSSPYKWDGVATGMEGADWSYADGGAVTFDSTAAEYIDLGTRPILAERFTLIFRCRPDNFSAQGRRILSKADGAAANSHDFMVNVQSDGDFRTRLSIDGTVVTTEADVPGIFVVGEWHTYGVWYDGLILRYYKDGLEFFTRGDVPIQGGLTATTAKPLSIGRNGSDATDNNSFEGAISYVMLWNRALGRRDLRDHMADPYAMFRPRRAPVFVPTPPPAGDIPIFAHHYRQLQGVN